MIKKLSIAVLVLLFAATGFTQDKSFYKTWNVSPENLIAHWNQSDPRAEATPQDLLDTTGNAVHLEQTTVTNQPVVTGTVNLSGVVDKYDGVDNFRVQEEIANGSGLTFLPDGPFMNLLDGEARGQLPGIPGAYINTDATHVVVITDSTDAVICYGYPRVADAAESWTELVINGDMEAALAVFDASDSLLGASEAQSAAQAHSGSNSSLITRITAGFGSFDKNYRDTDASTIANGQTVRLHAWLYLPSGQTTSTILIRFDDGPGVTVTLQSITATDTWTEVGPFYVLPTTTFQFTFRGSGDQGDIYYIDDLSIETVDTLGTSAALIWNTPSGGGTQSWLRGDGDPNDPATVRVNKSDLNITGDMSAFVLVKLDDGQSVDPQALIAKLGTTDNFISWMLSVQTDGRVQFVSSDNGTDTDTEKTDDVIFANGPSPWTLLGYTKLGSTVVLSVNGVAVPSTTTGAITDPIFDSPEPVLIGASNMVTPDRFLAGEIADLPIWGRGLSAAEVQNYWLSLGMRKLLGGL